MARKKKGGRGSGVTAAGGGGGRVGTQGGQSSGSNRQQRGPQRQNGATQVRNTERHRDNATAAASHVWQNGHGGSTKMNSSFFDRAVKSPTSCIRNISEGKRFLECMKSFPSKAKLLSQLEDSRSYGLDRITDVLSFVNSVLDVREVLIPLLEQILNEETNRPLFRHVRNKVLVSVYNIPGLLQALVFNDVIKNLDSASAVKICSFLQALTETLIESRANENVNALAMSLKERGDVANAKVLCSFLLVDEPDTREIVKDDKVASVACWVTDTIEPGDRHDNDHRNFRNIQILPTSDELSCEALPYLPLNSGENNFVSDKLTSLLDRNFRLLREDAVASMRTNLLEPSRGVWFNARIIDLEVSLRGISFVVQCDKRQDIDVHWKTSRSLLMGSVVAFCHDCEPIRMGIISIREDSQGNEWLNDPDGPKFGVHFESKSDFEASLGDLVVNGGLQRSIDDLKQDLREVDMDSPIYDSMLQRMSALIGRMISFDLKEVSKSFFAYEPVLGALQKMADLPFAEELVGGGDAPNTRPVYIPDNIRLPNNRDFKGMKFELSSWSTETVVSGTSLDKSQAEALFHGLTSQVALIQGPPGCGKTFIGALLARVIRQTTNESILCVCYTNHALDQFLEHMLDNGERNLVRIGGRSKSDRLKEYSLRDLARVKAKPDSFGQKRIKQVCAQLHKIKDEMVAAVSQLKEPLKWEGCVRDFLRTEQPDLYSYLSLPESLDGFNLVGRGGKDVREDFLWDSWRGGHDFPNWLTLDLDDKQIPGHQAFWKLRQPERLGLIEEWRKAITDPQSRRMYDLAAEFQRLVREKKSLSQDCDLQILRDARIIGATTAGAAMYREILSEKAAGVVLVEEAGEVLEAHVLSALLKVDNVKATKHLILIGDHMQLRPKLETYELTTVSGGGYNLDCSLFEHLITGGRPAVTLQVQHRMRPSFSALIRAQTYPSLLDHPSVYRYPHVKGTTKDLLFFNHRVPEDNTNMAETTSRSNSFEAEIAIELVRFFIWQGYKPDQIVVLTPYLGQLSKLVRLMQSSIRDVSAMVSEADERDLQDHASNEEELPQPTNTEEQKTVRCSSIDNFQGEEADIVIISLVRSNSRGNIGFLKEAQRVNVLLSRARQGMFLIGNADTFGSSQKGKNVWEHHLASLREKNLVRDGFPVVCQLHPDDSPLYLRTKREFRELRPHGGCLRPCDSRLSCGHACPLMCHAIDSSHEKTQSMCVQSCRRVPPNCPAKHPCLKRCNEECGACRTRVGPIALTCGHEVKTVLCHLVDSEPAIAKYSLSCAIRVTHSFLPCNHEMQTTCGNAMSSEPKCPSSCGVAVACGHPCSNK
jgi:AAA domain